MEIKEYFGGGGHGQPGQLRDHGLPHVVLSHLLDSPAGQVEQYIFSLGLQ